MKKQIFNYDPTSFAFISAAPADDDPMQPGEVLVPAFATAIEPPATKGPEIAVFRNGQWEVVPDWRDTALWSTDDGKPFYGVRLGLTLAELKATDVQPPSAVHSWVKGKWVLDATKQAEALAAAKTNALTRIDHFHSEVISRLVGNPTQTEKDTWAMKLDTANAIALGQPVAAAGTAFLHAAGLNDATAQTNWARVVLAKSTGYAQVVGVAERLRDAAKTAVKAAIDEAGVQVALDAQHAAADAAIAAISRV